MHPNYGVAHTNEELGVHLRMGVCRKRLEKSTKQVESQGLKVKSAYSHIGTQAACLLTLFACAHSLTLFAYLNIQVFDRKRLGLNELLARFHLVAHEDTEQAVGLFGIVNLNLPQDAVFHAHGRILQFFRVHFA